MSDQPSAQDGRTPSTGTSRSLLAAARVRDQSAWERLVALYAPLVLHWCRQWGLRDDDAADVFQDVFHSVAAHIDSFRKESSSDTFRGWLRTITRNKVNDAFRRQAREPKGAGGSEAQAQLSQLPEPPDLEDDASADPAVAGLLRRGLEQIRCEFETRTWQAFWLVVVEERDAKDVGAELGMSAGAVRVAKSRVLHRLRVELGDHGG
jgi:RNA polymerase sigma-70 factor (ECF subfamily)